MPLNSSHGRKRGESGNTADVHKRGEGLGHGPVGNVDYSSRREEGPSPSMHASSGGNGPKRSGGGGGLGRLLLLGMLLLGGGSMGLSNLFGGSSGGTVSTPSATQSSSGYYFGTPTTNNLTYTDGSTQSLNTSTTSTSREHFTKLKGNGQDTATILVYMCGTDLESNYGMATADLNEMAYATQSDQVNIIVQTGGTKKWQNTVMSNRTNQRWKVTTKALQSLDQNVGSLSMTDPNTLADFISWGTRAYPADRYELILWDHGGGSVTGYGYDELYPNGSMTVDEIAQALKKSGVKFDTVGFDACLMANMETAIAVSPYADYLIASEETEPGNGWYYTDWLTQFAKNPSMPTTEYGKNIIDSFIKAGGQTGREKLTLSLVDLAEVYSDVPSVLASFAKEISGSVKCNSYQAVADARSVTREFAQSNRIDQIDLMDFCSKLNTENAKKLTATLKSAVKYNRTANITNANGLSIYFPYRNPRLVNNVTNIYSSIGFDSDYADAVRSFATLTSSGQIAVSQQSNSLFDLLGGASSSNGVSFDASSLLGLLQGGSSQSSLDLSSLLGGSSGIDSTALDLFSAFIGKNMVSSDDLVYTQKNGETVLHMDSADWEKIHDVALNVWVDDGTGYIDLGTDNIYEFTDAGDLKIDYDHQWITLNGQVVAFYVLETEAVSENEWKTTGYVPAILNDELVHIILQFDQDNENGKVLGAQIVYETGVEAKGLVEIQDGDVIDFLCDYYDYGGNFNDAYYLGDTLTVSGGLTVSNARLTSDRVLFGYQLTDIYNAKRLTPMVEG